MDYKDFAQSIKRDNPKFEKANDLKLAIAVLANNPDHEEMIDLPMDELSSKQVSKLPGAYRKQWADNVRENTPSAQAAVDEALKGAYREEHPSVSAVFPRLSESIATGKGNYAQNVTNSIFDQISSAGKTFYAGGVALGDMMNDDMTMADVGRKYMETLQSPEGKNMVETIFKHPATPIAVAMAPYLAPVAASGTGGALAAGLAEGAVIGAATQLEDYGRDEDPSWAKYGLDVVSSVAFPAGAAALKKGRQILAPMTTKMSEVFKGWAHELTGLSSEAIEEATTKKGRQKLIAMSGKLNELGEKVITGLDNIDSNFPYRQQIDEALKETKPISVEGVLKTLRANVPKGNVGGKKGARDVIQKTISDIEKDYTRIVEIQQPGIGRFGERVTGPVQAREIPLIPATQIEDLKKLLYKEVDYKKLSAGESGIANKAIAKAANTLKTQLEDNAPEQFKPLMKKYAGAWELKERMKPFIGKIGDKMDLRIETFFNTIRKGSRKEQLFNDLNQYFGKNFTKEVGLARLGKEIAPEGYIPFFPIQKTGRITLGPGIAAKMVANIGDLTTKEGILKAGVAAGTGGLSSPAIAPQIIGGLRGMSKAPGVSESILMDPILQRTIPGLTRPGLQQGLGE